MLVEDCLAPDPKRLAFKLPARITVLPTLCVPVLNLLPMPDYISLAFICSFLF